MSKKTYYMELDTLKGVAIFCVLLCHAIILYPINLHENNIWKNVFEVASGAHMPLFFLVSGYCFSYKGNYKEFIGKKVFRLIIPYIVFGLVDTLPRQFMASFVNRSSSIGDSIKSMLLYGGEYWFLYTLFITFVIYPIIYCWQKNSTIRMIVVEAALLIIAILNIEETIFCLDSIMFYLFFFNTGALLKHFNIDPFKTDKLENGHRVMLIALILFLWIGGTLCFPDLNVVNLIIGIIASIAMVLLTKYKWFNTIFARIGKYSLQLYLLNGFLLVISRTIICKLTQIPVLIVMFNMFVTLVCSYIFIKYFCERFKIIRVFMGM